MTTAALAGFLTGLSLIVAIGAQNAFVLRQGLARRHVGAVVAVCAVSDLALIVAGVAGLGALVRHSPTLVDVVRVVGVVFLVAYGLRSLLHSRHAAALAIEDGPDVGASRTTGTALALTWLNPHVYLDTVLLLGTIAAAHGTHGRWAFAAGAGTASVVWFTALGYGSRLLRPLLTTARSWQVVDVVIGLTMLLVAGQLALGT